MADVIADQTGQTRDPRNPDGNRRRLIDPRVELLQHSITPDLLSPACFPSTTEMQAPGYHDERDKQQHENGSQGSAARGDHNHDYSLLHRGEDRDVGADDSDYVEPYQNLADGIAPPEDDPNRRGVTWDWKPEYPVNPGPSVLFARFTKDAGATYTSWRVVCVVDPTLDQCVYYAPEEFRFVDTTNVSAQYRLVLPNHDRTAALKLTRTGVDGKLAIGFMPASMATDAEVAAAVLVETNNRIADVDAEEAARIAADAAEAAARATADALLLVKSANLSDVGSAATSRANLIVGKFTVGTGSPESVVTGVPGDLFVRTDGPPSAYYKATGTGNTGWIASNAGGFTAPTGTGYVHTTAGALDAASKTPTQVTADLIPFVGDSGSGGLQGLVPAPAAGDAAAGKVLGAGGTWVSPRPGLRLLQRTLSRTGISTGTFTRDSRTSLLVIKLQGPGAGGGGANGGVGQSGAGSGASSGAYIEIEIGAADLEASYTETLPAGGAASTAGAAGNAPSGPALIVGAGGTIVSAPAGLPGAAGAASAALALVAGGATTATPALGAGAGGATRIIRARGGGPGLPGIVYAAAGPVHGGDGGVSELASGAQGASNTGPGGALAAPTTGDFGAGGAGAGRVGNGAAQSGSAGGDSQVIYEEWTDDV